MANSYDEDLDFSGLFEAMKNLEMSRRTGDLIYSSEENFQIQIGAVWEGNWWEDPDIDHHKFGSETKKRHWAALREIFQSSTSICFSPITTKKQRPDLFVVIPPGIIAQKQGKESYLLYKFKIRLSEKRLKEKFVFYRMLPKKIISEFKRKICEGAKR